MSERFELDGEAECPFCYGAGVISVSDEGVWEDCEACGGEGALPIIAPTPDTPEANR